MPEVTSDEIGRRKFQIQKEKAVEVAVEKMRQNLGSAWRFLSASDVDALKYVLGEAWVSIERSTWEKYAFARLTERDVRSLAETGKNLRNRQIGEHAALEEVREILLRTL
ncbi:MAG: hypothetical protein QMD46_09115 [Methanomicrobiales archaeon]|nr:hypothetical protein [Methanomicrobiales archaeon]